MTEIVSHPSAQFGSQMPFLGGGWGVYCVQILKTHFRHAKLDAFQIDVAMTARAVNYLLQGF